MSFSGTVKEELSHTVPNTRHCRIAELAVFLLFFGELKKTPMGRPYLVIRTENLPAARKCFTLIRKTFKMDVKIRRGKRAFSLVLPPGEDSLKVLSAVRLAGRLTEDGAEKEALNRLLIQELCCKRAFIRGMFLACGSLSDPQKSYHMEFVCEEASLAQQVVSALAAFEVEAKITLRKNSFIVYLKEGDALVEVLNIMGAFVSMMEMENVRILRGFRGSVNRQVNCETANIRKTVSAAVGQMDDIRYLQQTIGLDALPDGLREIAEIRLENPEATLKELGDSLNPPVGKSGVNHRLRKIKELAENIREERK